MADDRRRCVGGSGGDGCKGPAPDPETQTAAWVDANPSEAEAQNGFSVRAKPLDELDEQFYRAEREMPITLLAVRWISGWPELRIVADYEYSGTIDQIAGMNPFLSPRLIWRNIQNIRYQMTDSLQIGIAVACGAVAPETEAKTAVRAGAYFE